MLFNSVALLTPRKYSSCRKMFRLKSLICPKSINLDPFISPIFISKEKKGDGGWLVKVGL